MKIDIARLVFNDLFKRKFSSFLTLFAISLGILTIFTIFLISSGFENSLSAEMEKYGTNRLYLTSVTTPIASTSFTKGLSDSDIRYVESRPYVKDVFPYFMKFAEMKNGNDFATTQLVGTYVDKDYFDAGNIEVEFGRVPKSSEKYSLVIGSLSTTDLFDRKIGVGSNIYIKDVKFKVVGVMKSIGNPQDDMLVLGNIDTLRDIYETGDAVGLADILIESGYDISLAKENLLVAMENRLGKDSVEIRSPTELLDQMSTIMDIIKYTLGGIGFVALIVGSLGIVNTMYVVVSEKKRDIGIMKAIGATNFAILFMFVFQAGIFGLFGGLLGVFMGAGAGVLFETLAQSFGYTFLKITFNWIAGISLIFFSFFVGAVSGYVPAREASKINIIDAIMK